MQMSEKAINAYSRPSASPMVTIIASGVHVWDLSSSSPFVTIKASVVHVWNLTSSSPFVTIKALVVHVWNLTSSSPSVTIKAVVHVWNRTLRSHHYRLWNLTHDQFTTGPESKSCSCMQGVPTSPPRLT